MLGSLEPSSVGDGMTNLEQTRDVVDYLLLPRGCILALLLFCSLNSMLAKH